MLLELLGISARQITSGFEEESIEFRGDPEAYTKQIASGKAKIIAERFPQALVIAADTTVYARGHILNKPRDSQEAKWMLETLSGISHSVFTGVSVIYEGQEITKSEKTTVRFAPLREEQIEYYIKTQPIWDKAGGYTISGPAALFIERIEGCYYNVVGLPLNVLSGMLEQLKIDIWKCING